MDSLHRVLEYTKQYWKPLFLSILYASFYGIAAAVPTYLIKHTVDDVFIKRYSHLIVPFILLFVLFFALKGLFMYLTSYYMYWVGNKVVNDLRSDLFHKIIYFPMSFFQQNTTGKLMSHFLNDIQMIQSMSSSVVKDGVRSFFEAIFLVGLAFYQNWILASIMMIVGPVIGVSIRKMGKARKKASMAIQQEMGKMSGVLQESFVGIREIKAFNAEKTEHTRLIDRLHQCFISIMRNVQIEALAPACVEVIAILGCGFVFYIAAQQVLSGSITAGQLTSFVAALILSYQPLKKIVAVYSEIQYGLAAADRIFELMDLVSPAARERTLVLKSFDHAIEFKNISFSYDSTEVFKQVSLVINKGDRIGIMGPSGAGKSTFCDLLLGFIEPTSGIVTIDGKDITRIPVGDLRHHIGYVGQRMFLFNDTIYNNVLYANPHAAPDEVFMACKAAHADEFIRQCENGYDTVVGENGTLLSGGQKQRLTIARALLKNPDILIFDEATSALDGESEQMIRLALQEISREQTIIIVTHRPSMLEVVDTLFVINNGEIRKAPSIKEVSFCF
jgi:subfamily B ATP-binding cassette protein MsbA